MGLFYREKFSANFAYDEADSPMGKLIIAASENSLYAIFWKDRGMPANGFFRSSANPIIVNAKKQLVEYFAGKRRSFDLPIAPVGTEFQLQAWDQLVKIPYGATISYQSLAEQMGNPKAMRAVGMANGKNPIPIVIPCHRVIGKNGSLTGFSGGLDKKAYLLELEKTNRFSGAE